MWARKRIDIGWGDLCYGALKSLSRSSARDAEIDVGSGPDDRAVPCLSVRTGFDLLLKHCAFPPGSEVLMSAVNIEGMFRIVEAHGLVPVPLDIDHDRLLPSLDEVRNGITPLTKMLVIAHLFGADSDLDAFNRLCAEQDLVLVEDHSQSFAGALRFSQGACLAHLYSFGSIKTATALGGALVTLREPETARALQKIEAMYPALSRSWFLRRILKYSFLKLLAYRLPYGLMMRVLRTRADALVSRLARGFGSSTDLRRIRRRPPPGMIALLAYRLRGLRGDQFEQARARGRWLRSRLADVSSIPGAAAETHEYTLFPVMAKDPRHLMRRLAAAGFDSTMRGSLVVLPAPAHRGQAGASCAQEMLERIVFLPFYDDMPARELARMADVVRGAERSCRSTAA